MFTLFIFDESENVLGFDQQVLMLAFFVIGSAIFAVEAGIHADGISKAPYTYEPFIPESVGKARSLVVGKHSGTKAIEIKLHDLGIEISENAIPELLIKVQEASVLLGRSLTDEEFMQLACLR